MGAKHAKGDYLLFLNPDTLVTKNAIDELCKFLNKDKKTGIVSPLILKENRQPLDMQGYKQLSLLNGIFTFSFLRKWFPQMTVSNFYSLGDWSKTPIKKVDTVYGAALMITAKIFKRVNGFDERFFLYFEENDLSKRVRDLGYKLYIDANSRIIHMIGHSTKQINARDSYFAKSRFLYFKKHFGIFQALLLESVLKINKQFLFILLIFIISLLLRIYNLSQNMVFIGDQGWFYLSARDMLIHGQIPLVGITSSHTWLHQGPLWTYLLSIALFLFRFNPVSGGYLTALFGAITVILLYKLGSEMFSEKVGVIASLLYCFSPLVVFSDRMPFDPSLIPFFAILYFYALFKWVNGNKKYFSLIFLWLAFLYNLELATFTLVFPLVLIFVYGLFKNKLWVKMVLTRKIVVLTVLATAIPMLPVIIYDFSHGFKQTVVFLGWTLYKPFSFLVQHSSGNLLSNTLSIINFLEVNLQKLIFGLNLEIALLLFFLSFFFLSYRVYKDKFNVSSARFLLLFLLTVSLLGILLNQTPSDAYLPIIFPFAIFLIALFFQSLIGKSVVRYVAIVLLAIVLIFNFYISIKMSQTRDLQNRLTAVNQIIKIGNHKKYNLIGQGAGSQFQSFTMDYEYLLWWKGYPPSKTPEQLRIGVSENNGNINVFQLK